MKIIPVVAMCLVAELLVTQGSFAQSAPPPPGKPQKGSMGGFVTRVIGDGGTVRFIDTCGKLPSNAGEIFQRMERALGVQSEAASDKITAENCPMKIAQKALAGKDAAVAIVIAATGNDNPSLVVCPEDKIAVINADKLATKLPADNAKEILSSRIEKEMWRAVAFVMGGWESDMPCVMMPVFSVEQFDANEMLMTCPPVSGKIQKNAKELNVRRTQHVPYMIAARQGWAPAPTNEVQQKIWNRFNKKAAVTNAPVPTAEAPATK